MNIHYYCSLFPLEALIASQLGPKQFAAYMATGTKRGSEEQIIFSEVTGDFGDHFDWEYAKKRCIPHANGDPKHSVYLGVYRVLEHIPLEAFGLIYLTTRDGRALPLEPGDFSSAGTEADYYLFQELCPINPVIVSKLPPDRFAEHICNPENRVTVPKLVFTDLKVLPVDDTVNTGNIGPMYSSRKAHLLECISSITSSEEKINKTLTRTNVESFSFQVINNGIYISDGQNILMYKMPNIKELEQIDYDWGRSAQLF